MVQKAVDHSGESEEQAKKRKSLPKNVALHIKGIAGGSLPEPIPMFNKTESEKVIEGANNTYIVFGRDRPASRLSGFGGTGIYLGGDNNNLTNIIANNNGDNAITLEDSNNNIFSNFIVDTINDAS